MQIKKILSAWAGRRIYLNIRKRLMFADQDIILFFPENLPEEIGSAIQSVPQYLKKNKRDGAFCIWPEMAYPQPWVKGSIILTRMESRHLLDFYDLYHFNHNFIVVSLRLPWGRLAYRMEQCKGLTKEDLYRHQVFY